MSALFTKKHFDWMAETLAVASEMPEFRTALAHHFADRLEGTNLLFKKDRFLEACGVNGSDDTSSSTQ